LGGIIVLGWWIVPLGVFFGAYFSPKLSEWPRRAAIVRGVLLGAALGLLTAVFFALVSRHSTPTHISDKLPKNGDYLLVFRDPVVLRWNLAF
jgi:hypothetical protein